MPPINVKALCVFLHDEMILVKECTDPHSNELFYRPAGGGVEFGEHSSDTIVREIREELGAEITLPEFLGVLENIFTYDGAQGHEVVFIYDAKFVDPKFYKMAEVLLDENGVVCKAVWKPLSFFISGDAPLYPDGLLTLLMR
jgi:ADP-ribose pyrophosphatase YjhB (NUDIX family)